jgi:tRNA-dihydrouridine synthase
VVLGHFRAHVTFVGNALAAVRSFRKHLSWYSHGLRGAAAFRAEVNQLIQPEQVELTVRRFFQQAETDGDTVEEQDVDYRAALG